MANFLAFLVVASIGWVLAHAVGIDPSTAEILAVLAIYFVSAGVADAVAER